MAEITDVTTCLSPFRVAGQTSLTGSASGRFLNEPVFRMTAARDRWPSACGRILSHDKDLVKHTILSVGHDAMGKSNRVNSAFFSESIVWHTPSQTITSSPHPARQAIARGTPRKSALSPTTTGGRGRRPRHGLPVRTRGVSAPAILCGCWVPRPTPSGG